MKVETGKPETQNTEQKPNTHTHTHKHIDRHTITEAYKNPRDHSDFTPHTNTQKKKNKKEKPTKIAITPHNIL